MPTFWQGTREIKKGHTNYRRMEGEDIAKLHLNVQHSVKRGKPNSFLEIKMPGF